MNATSVGDVLSPHNLVFIAILALVGFRIYRRIRRLIGRQPVVAWRLVFTAVAFPLLAVFVALPNLRSLQLIEGLVAGAFAGIGMGLLGLRLTRFEATPGGRFFTPNVYLGVAISLLFIGRLLYRFGTIWWTTGSVDPATLQSFGRSALTLASFGLVAAYYTTFAIGVLAWSRRTPVHAPQPVDPPFA